MSAALRDPRLFATVALSVLAVTGCAMNSPSVEPPPPAPAAAPEMPGSIRSEEIVGRWGYGSYHRDEDRPRTEAAARGQCSQPVVINRAPDGGVMMYLADSAQLQDLHVKGGPNGGNYIGPPGPAGGKQDREVVSFDGRVMILRWLDPEVAGRYGTGVYVRCGAEGMARSGKGQAR
jgi:hypothetical protein